jgi:signal peptidase I
LGLDENYVKRAIGLPGDRLRIENKQVILNGRVLHEPYVIHKTNFIDPYRDNFPSAPNSQLPARALEMLARHVRDGEVVVPPGHYFALGDNRDQSSDSRYWGFVPRENIVGTPLLIYWSYDAPTDRLLNPSFGHVMDLALNFFTKTRWERTFQRPRSYRIE